MDTQSEAQLYLADQRGCSQVDYFRSFHGFNFGSYSSESRTPFGTLHLLNDNTLKAGCRISMQVEQNTDVILLPLVGGLEYNSPAGAGFLEAGQAQILSLSAAMAYQISNPYDTELINFLEIGLINQSGRFTPEGRQTQFDLTTKNNLLPLFSRHEAGQPGHAQWHCLLGRYEGRNNDVYSLTDPINGVFVFILSGAFEVQNRLLHERDGLALTTIRNGEVEFEALSNDALLMVLEIPL